jgi:Trehalose-phosphatase
VTEDAHAGAALARHAARLVERADAVALCLDFDGTLAPIVDDPEQARPLSGMVELLGPLAARFAAVALLSGRPAGYLFEHAAAPGVRYLGLYGLQEIRDGQVWVDPLLEASRPAVMRAQQDLRDSPVVRDCGAYLEDKVYAVAVHTRRVADPARWAGRSKKPPDRSPTGTGWRSSWANWSGSFGRRSAATRATRFGGSWPSPVLAQWSWRATISGTCQRSPRQRNCPAAPG